MNNNKIFNDNGFIIKENFITNKDFQDLSKELNAKIEEMLMNAFINSKNNLEKFEKGVDKIASMIEKGMNEYSETKKQNEEIIKEVNKTE